MSLYENMNRRKKLGISRSKKNSTVSDKAYKNMKAGFPKPNPKEKEESQIGGYMAEEKKTNSS